MLLLKDQLQTVIKEPCTLIINNLIAASFLVTHYLLGKGIKKMNRVMWSIDNNMKQYIHKKLKRGRNGWQNCVSPQN